MPKIHNPLLWIYFEPNPDDKTAECKQCHKKLSYKTTSANLKMHLKVQHVNAFNELNKQDPSHNKPRRLHSRSSNLLIWNYFEKKEDEDKRIAECRLCKKKLSYKTTIANLKHHLKVKHVSSYNEFEQGESVGVDSSVEDYTSCESDDACEELLKVTDVWSYFDTDSGKRAQCTVCRTTLGNEYEELKAHLKDHHPKLLLQLLQNKDQDSDAASNDRDDDEENTYTEIVYLEQDATENVTKHKEKPKSFQKPMKKRERLQSLYSSEEIPVKKAKKEDENDELGTFIKYITCLLKKLPADVFSNVQIEIINTILKANSQTSTANTSRSKELINTSSNMRTVDGITPTSSTMMGHNYTITIAPPKESETKNDG